MNKELLDEKVYFDDFKTKVTASFVAGFRQVILPVERIRDVKIVHKAVSMYMCFLSCLLLILLLVLAPFLPTFLPVNIPVDYVWFFFIPVFGIFCIWFRFIYENYVELYVRLDNEKKYKLRVITLGKRDTIYDIADAIQAACQDYQTNRKNHSRLDTDSMKIRRLKDMLLQSEVDLTPELKQVFDREKDASVHGS